MSYRNSLYLLLIIIFLIGTVLYLIVRDNVSYPDLIVLIGCIVIAAGIVKILPDWHDSIEFVKGLFEEKSESVKGYSKQRVYRRQRFARHLVNELERLNLLESWSDFRFTELEAEVEAEGNYQTREWFGLRKGNALRRVANMTEALQTSKERLILLEGKPGSGKSVALRHVALKMARNAENGKSLKTIIPIYINLKNLNRKESEPVDKSFILNHVLTTLNRPNDRDIEIFLEDEFTKGMEEETWFFLFDSFDEIPEILSTTEANKTIEEYGQAISDFLSGMNNCRGIIASREYRGPGMLKWPKFRILDLSDERQKQLIFQADMRSYPAQIFIEEFTNSHSSIRNLASNPMFLSMMIEYVDQAGEFPRIGHEVYQKYIDNRLQRDKQRLAKRFSINPEELKIAAERIAFCMTANDELSLNATRSEILRATHQVSLELGTKFDSLLNALEFIKLGRSESPVIAGLDRDFSFTHRLIQEFFATSFVMKNPNYLSTIELVVNGKWRETCVTLCKTQPIKELTEVFDCFYEVLRTMNPASNTFYEKQDGLLKVNWGKDVLHVLGIMEDGFHDRVEYVPVKVRSLARMIIKQGYQSDWLLDKKWLLEVSSILDQKSLLVAIKKGLASSSNLLTNTAYKKLSSLNNLDNYSKDSIFSVLLNQALSADLFKNYQSTLAYLKRLPQSNQFLNIAQYIYQAANYYFFLHFLLLLSRPQQIS